MSKEGTPRLVFNIKLTLRNERHLRVSLILKKKIKS